MTVTSSHSPLRERGLPMTGPNVLAIRAGRKLLTSRVMVPQPLFPFGVKQIVVEPDVWHDDALAGTPAEGMGNKGAREMKFYCEDFAGNIVANCNAVANCNVKCPYGRPGETMLVIQEAFRVDHVHNASSPHRATIQYKADGSWRRGVVIPESHWDMPSSRPRRGFLPGRFMPLWAGRVRVPMTSLRAVRVQDMSPEEAILEGIEPAGEKQRVGEKNVRLWRFYGTGGGRTTDPLQSYGTLWDSINLGRADGAYAYARNPWTWRIGFSPPSPEASESIPHTSPLNERR